VCTQANKLGTDDDGGNVSRFIDWDDSFGLILTLLVTSMLVIAVLGDNYYGAQIAVMIQAVVVLLIYRVSSVSRRTYIIAACIAALAVVASIVGTFAGRENALAISALALLLLLGLGPAVIARRLRDYTHVNAQMLYAALCIYLIAGMFFSVLYRLIGFLDSPPVFAQIPNPSPMDSLYFSFTTLTTLGYGDLTPVGDIGRMLAITEALVGQVYLVTVMALIVMNLGRERRRKEPDPTSTDQESR